MSDICGSKSNIKTSRSVPWDIIFPRLQVTVVFPTPPLKLITAMDFGLMAGFVWILLKYKLKHIVAVSRSPVSAVAIARRCVNSHEKKSAIKKLIIK